MRMRCEFSILRKKSIQVVLITFLAMLGVALSNFSVDAAEDTVVIKVGYMLNYGTIKSPMIKGSEGYGYEYLTEIFKCADGDYELEFVYCDWTEAKEMLVNGEIDILGPSTYTTAGESVYTYPDESFGSNVILLSTLSENNIYYNSFDDIDGSVIAVQDGNPNEYLLYEFLDEYNLDAEIVYFSDNDYEGVLEENDYDFCLASSLQTFSDLSAVAILGVVDFYYVTSEDNEALMEIINSGMKQIESQEFLYQEKLYLKYYDYTIASTSFVTEEEYSNIQEQEVYKVGIQNLYSPICYVENGEYMGVSVDVMEMLAELAGIQYELVEVTDETTDEELAELDFAFISFEDDGREDAVESDSYYEIPFLLLDRYMDEEIETIGILTYYGITEIELEDHLYGRTIYEYNNIVELIAAYNAGEVDSMIVTSATLNMIRDDLDDLDFISNTLDSSLNLTITFHDDYSDEKIDAFNKLIAQLDDAAIATSLLQHSSERSEVVNIADFLKENPEAIAGISIVVVLYVLISEYKRRRALYRLLNFDELTGLSSRHGFIQKTRKTIRRRSRKKYTLVSIDIDNFKYINEFYSYEVGTFVLKEVAKSIKEHGKRLIVTSRVNADNFLLLVRREHADNEFSMDLSPDGALVRRLHQHIEESYDISFSIGVYDIEDKKVNLNFMIDCANTARILGKTSAFTTVHKFTAEMDSRRIINNDIIANMAKAITEEQFVLYYQPKIEFETGVLTGAEALVRWAKNGEIVSPNHFIPIFEKNGFIERLDYYVLSKACEFINKNPKSPKVSVNLSGVTVVKDNVVKKILEVVDSTKTPHEKIDIEITETAFVDKFEQAINNIQLLRDSGFTISMDDFGVGISSLNRLKSMPIDTLKIDRAFIVDAIDNDKGEHIIKNIIHMAKDLELETVAEGIETKEQEKFLKEHGCDIGQGYYFSRPMPEKEYIKYIKKNL